MKAVFFEHMASSGPAYLKDILQSQGIDCQVVCVSYEDISSFDALSPDILVVMGGSPGVYQAEHYDFLKHEQRILEQRLAADRPTLGICLGAQLMAAALGARVYKGQQGPEIGWFDLMLTAAAQDSPVKEFENTKIMQWHGDTFDAPAGTTLLASSTQYPQQIFSYGRHCIGFQGHIEVTPKVLTDWFVQDAGIVLSRPGLLDDLRRDTALYAETMTKATERFMKKWLADILPQQEKKHA